MFKKVLPVIVLVFVAACAYVPGGKVHHSCPCAHLTDCTCHKHEECTCCDDESGMCKLCHGEGHEAASGNEAQPCPICLDEEA